MNAVVSMGRADEVGEVPAPLAYPRAPKPTGASSAPRVPELTLAVLISHILDRYHAHARSELDRLGALAKTVGAGALSSLPTVRQVLAAFTALGSELRAHMTKEEVVVFPYIVSLEAHQRIGRSLARSPFGILERPLKAMLDEQDQTRALLASMRNASGGYALPLQASPALVALYRGLEALEDDLEEHGQLETRVLFPQALDLEQEALR